MQEPPTTRLTRSWVNADYLAQESVLYRFAQEEDRVEMRKVPKYGKAVAAV